MYCFGQESVDVVRSTTTQGLWPRAAKVRVSGADLPISEGPSDPTHEPDFAFQLRFGSDVRAIPSAACQPTVVIGDAR